MSNNNNNILLVNDVIKWNMNIYNSNDCLYYS